MKDEFHGVPPDVDPILKRIVRELGRLTVLDQQSVLELLVVRHVIRRAYPEAGKVLDVLADVIACIVTTTKKAMEENHVRKNKS